MQASQKKQQAVIDHARTQKETKLKIVKENCETIHTRLQQLSYKFCCFDKISHDRATSKNLKKSGHNLQKKNLKKSGPFFFSLRT